jgi:hypothetical protein
LGRHAFVRSSKFQKKKYTNPNGTRNVKHADIAFLNMPPSAFDAQRVYGDVTHRTVVGFSDGNPTAKYGAHLRAGAALQHADAAKTRVYDEALRGRQNEKVAILGIEAGGRMHKHFHRLIGTFAKFKADVDAGPPRRQRQPRLDQVSPIGFFAHEILSHGQDSSRAREVRGGTDHVHHPPAHPPPPPRALARERQAGRSPVRRLAFAFKSL